jgi:hypothetical protein
VSIRVDTDILIISNSMRLVTADTAQITESHVPILNTLSPRDNFSRTRFVVRLTPTNGTKFLLYRQRLFAGNGNRLMWAGRHKAG